MFRRNRKKERKLYEEVYKTKHGRYPPLIIRIFGDIRFYLLRSTPYIIEYTIMLIYIIGLADLILMLLLILKYISTN